MTRHHSLLLVAALALSAPAARGQDVPARKLPGDNLLFNGWAVTPSGQPVKTSDLALKMVVAPDKKRLAAVSGGYNDQGLTLIDLAEKRVTQFLPMAEAWNGLAFSNDGHRIFVSAGDEGTIP